MKLNNKEEILKQILSDVEFELDTNQLWADVDKEVNKKKKRRWMPFFLLGLVSLGLIISGLFYTVKSDASFDTSESLIVTNSIARESVALQVPIDEFKKTTPASIDFNNETKLSTDLGSKPSRAQTKRSVDSPIQTSNNNTSHNYYETNDRESLEEYSLQSDVSKTVTTRFPEDETRISPIQRDVIKNVSRDLLVGGYIESLPPSTIHRNKFNLDLDLKTKVLRPKKFALFIAASVGLSTHQNKYDFDSNSDFDTELLRKEESMPSLAVALNFGLETNTNWRFYAGVNYNSMVARFSNKSEVINTVLEPGTEYNYINVDGSTSSTSGLIEVTTISNNDIQWHRQHLALDLELGLAKSIRLGHNFRLVPSVSMLTNVKTINRGYYFLETSDQIAKFDSGDESPYRGMTGMKIKTGLGIEYDLRENSIGLNGSYINHLNSTTQEYFYTIRNSQYNLELRLVHRL